MMNTESTFYIQYKGKPGNDYFSEFHGPFLSLQTAKIVAGAGTGHRIVGIEDNQLYVAAEWEGGAWVNHDLPLGETT